MAKKMRKMQNWNPVMKWAEKEGLSASSFLLDTEGTPKQKQFQHETPNATARSTPHNQTARARRRQTSTVMSRGARETGGYGLG